MTNKKIPQCVRQQVWNSYIGDDIGKTKCLLCEQNDITPFQFHCAHVIAKSRDGKCDVSNLRPLCSVCNQSMTFHNMIEFARKFHPQSGIHQTFEKIMENKPIEQTIEIINIPNKEVIIKVEKIIADAQLQRVIECPLCFHKYNDLEQLQSHVINCRVSSQKKLYVCDYCQRQFNNRSNRYKHATYHCKNRPVKSLENTIEFSTAKTFDDVNNSSQVEESNQLGLRDVSPSMVTLKKNPDDGITSSKSEPRTNLTDPLIIELLVNQQKQIENLQKQMEEERLNREKQIEEKEKSNREKLDQILAEIKEKPSTQNITNNVLIINNYFNSSLDLYDLTVKEKGKEFAQNYYIYTIHKNKKYFEPIMEFLVKPDISKSPIRLGENNAIELHRSATLIESDETGDILEKDTKSIVSKAYLKAFNQTDQKDLVYESMDKNFFCHKLKYDEPEKSKLRRKEAKELQNCILDGDDNCPPLKTLHVNLAKIDNYKINGPTRKKIIKDLSGPVKKI